MDVPQRRARAINIDVFLRLPIRGAHPYHIALVGDDVVELVLPKKAGQGGVAFALFLAGLD